MLAGPFGRLVGEARHPHSMRQAAFDGSFHQVRRQEGQRDRHVDLAGAAPSAPGEVVGPGGGKRRHLSSVARASGAPGAIAVNPLETSPRPLRQPSSRSSVGPIKNTATGPEFPPVLPRGPSPQVESTNTAARCE
jgi:hypothetical protein